MSAIPRFSQIGGHLADADTADAVRVHTGGAGMILGADHRGRAVTATVFRPEPTAVVTVGSLGLAQLVGFRALALGAHLVVATARPSAWASLGAVSATTVGGMQIVPPDVPLQGQGSTRSPLLLVRDSDAVAAAGGIPAVLSWTTLLTVREQVGSWDTGPYASADLVLVQGLAPPEAEVLCPALSIPEYREAFCAVPPGTIGLVTQGGVTWARVAQTAVEHQVIGPIERT